MLPTIPRIPTIPKVAPSPIIHTALQSQQGTSTGGQGMRQDDPIQILDDSESDDPVESARRPDEPIQVDSDSESDISLGTMRNQNNAGTSGGSTTSGDIVRKVKRELGVLKSENLEPRLPSQHSRQSSAAAGLHSSNTQSMVQATASTAPSGQSNVDIPRALIYPTPPMSVPPPNLSSSRTPHNCDIIDLDDDLPGRMEIDEYPARRAPRKRRRSRTPSDSSEDSDTSQEFERRFGPNTPWAPLPEIVDEVVEPIAIHWNPQIPKIKPMSAKYKVSSRATEAHKFLRSKRASSPTFAEMFRMAAPQIRRRVTLIDNIYALKTSLQPRSALRSLNEIHAEIPHLDQFYCGNLLTPLRRQFIVPHHFQPSLNRDGKINCLAHGQRFIAVGADYSYNGVNNEESQSDGSNMLSPGSALIVFDTVLNRRVPLQTTNPDTILSRIFDIQFDPHCNNRFISSGQNDHGEEPCTRVWLYQKSGVFEEENMPKEYETNPHHIQFNSQAPPDDTVDGIGVTMHAVGVLNGSVYIYTPSEHYQKCPELVPASAKQGVSALLWGTGPTCDMLFVGTSEDGEQGCNGVQGVYKPASGMFQLMDPLPGWEVHTMDINTQGNLVAVGARTKLYADGVGRGTWKTAIFLRAVSSSGYEDQASRRTRHQQSEKPYLAAARLPDFAGMDDTYDKTPVITEVKFSPCGMYIAVGRNDDKIFVYDSRFLQTNRIVMKMAHESPGTLSRDGIQGLRWVTGIDGRHGLISGGSDRCVRLWDVANESPSEILATMAGDVTGFSILESSNYPLVVGDSSGTVVPYAPAGILDDPDPNPDLDPDTDRYSDMDMDMDM